MTTRANAETELVTRLGPWLSNVGMAITVVGSNASLNGALAYAIVLAGGTVVDPALVTSTDIATVAAADLYKFYDLAELRTLETILSNFTLVDAKAGPVEAKSSQFADRLERLIARKKADLATAYGIGAYSAFSVTLTRTDGYSELADA